VPPELLELQTQIGRVADELTGPSRSCARSPAASTRRSCPRAGWARPCAPCAAAPRSRWNSTSGPKPAPRTRSRWPPTTSCPRP
jgi:hypothetical protein